MENLISTAPEASVETPVDSSVESTESPALAENDGYQMDEDAADKIIGAQSERNRAKGTLREGLDDQSEDLVWGNGDKFDFDLTGIEDFDPSKYQKPEDVIRHNLSMRKKVSEFTPPPVAPEAYEVNPEEFDVEDGYLKEYSEIAKKHNIQQEGYTEILGLARKQAVEMQEAQAAKKEAEVQKWKDDQLRKLGDNPQKRWDKVTSWVDQEMPDEMHDTVTKMIQSADQLIALEYIMSKQTQYTPPSGRHIASKSANKVYTSEGLNELLVSKEHIQGDPAAINIANDYTRRLIEQNKKKKNRRGSFS